MTSTNFRSLFRRPGLLPALLLVGLLSTLLSITLLPGCSDKDKMREQEAQIELLQQKLDEKSEELETLDKSFEEIGSYLDAIRSAERDVRAGMERGRKRNKAELIEHIGRLGSFVDSLNNRILFLENRMKNNESNSSRYAGLEKMISTLRQQLVEKEEEIASLRTEVNSLQGIVASTKRQVEEKEGTIAAQQEQIASKAQQLDEKTKAAQAALEEAKRAHAVNVRTLLADANREYEKAKARGGLLVAKKAQKAEYQAALKKYEEALALIKTHQLADFSVSQTEQRIQEIKKNFQY